MTFHGHPASGAQRIRHWTKNNCPKTEKRGELAETLMIANPPMMGRERGITGYDVFKRRDPSGHERPGHAARPDSNSPFLRMGKSARGESVLDIGLWNRTAKVLWDALDEETRELFNAQARAENENILLVLEECFDAQAQALDGRAILA